MAGGVEEIVCDALMAVSVLLYPVQKNRYNAKETRMSEIMR